MNTLVDEVRREVVELHEFFTAWFNGTASREHLDARFIARLHPDMLFVSPEGQVLKTPYLRAAFERSYGSNPGFRIQIRDVTVRLDTGVHLLATYTEWQIGAKASAQTNNARFTTVFMEKGTPMTWLHVQETWLPEEVRQADPFEF